MSQEPAKPAADKDLHLRAYLSRWWHELVHLDGPTWRTFWALMKSPGQLAAAQCESVGHGGVASPYSVHPIRLYLTINIVFFFLGPWFNTDAGNPRQVTVWHVEHSAVVQMHPLFENRMDRQIESSGVDESLYRLIFDQRMSAQQGAVVFVWIPLLGLAGFLAYRRRRRFFAEHLILATHLISFFLVSLLAVGITARLSFLLPEKPSVVLAVIAIVAWMLWIPVTFYRSVRRFHDLKSHLATAVFSGWMFAVFFAGFLIYLQLLFLWTLFGLRDLRVLS